MKEKYKIYNRKALFITFFICIWAKFILFNIIWCTQTTFSPFSTVEMWGNAILLSWILLLPIYLFRMYRINFGILLLLDIFFITNLMYFRTYYTTIPLESYTLIKNLVDFSSSVATSFKLIDLIFPLLTIITGVIWWKRDQIRNKNKTTDLLVPEYRLHLKHIIFTLLLLLIINFRVIACGGYVKAYESLFNEYKYSYVTPMYTPFGSLLYEQLKEKETYSPEIEEEIISWFNEKEEYQKEELNSWTSPRNCIIILAESFESWVIEKEVEGIEITPYLNKLLDSPGTMYAPHILSQVKGGRSIDAQLLINAGLLPVSNGSYSSRFPHSHYPTLIKALKEKHPESTAYSVTVDKPFIWNQSVIAPAFGYDSLLTKYSFIEDEMVGERKKLGDVSFLQQIAEKIDKKEIWSDEHSNFLQLITYSGHSPFVLPDNLKRVSFSQNIPSILSRYMTVANYTDYAIGKFIELLKEQGRFDDTLIIITGDHEGLSGERNSLCQHAVGSKIIGDKPYVPFIVLNAPVSMRYEKTGGQIDIYPTLLELLGLTDYEWKGLGTSILSPDHKGFAIDAAMEINGDTTNLDPDLIKLNRDAWNISDQIIRYNFLGIKSPYAS